MEQVITMPSDMSVRTEVQGLLQEALRLLDEASFARSAAYAQMALDCLCADEPDGAERRDPLSFG